MNDKKIITATFIMLASVVLIIIIGIVSYLINSKSQKLPAVVRSEKLLVSSKTSGTVKKIAVELNQQVSQGQLLIELENEFLSAKIENLINEKNQLEKLIISASGGDHLILELAQIEEDVAENSDDLKRLELKKDDLSNQILIYKDIYDTAKLEYEAYKELYNEDALSVSEFDERSSEFLEIANEYRELENDVLLTSSEIETKKKYLQSLLNKKKMFSENVSLVAENHLLNLQELKSKLNELENEAAELNVTAPISGTISEINCELGESVGKGKNIVEISLEENIWIIAYGNSFSRQKIKKGMKAKIFCTNGEKIQGKIETVSPVMKKVKALTPTFETANTYTEIKIIFVDPIEAKNSITSGERLFVRIYF